jgi:hypothetical protein
VLDVVRGHARDVADRFSQNRSISGETLKTGKIDTKAKGQDTFHNSAGTWTLLRVGNELYLQSGEDFRSSPGPDYHVYISDKPAIKDNDAFETSGQLEVSRLKKPNGAAYYLLPTKNPAQVTSVLIWCKQFNEYIGSADLK